MRKSIFLSLVTILVMGGSTLAANSLDSLRVATANLSEGEITQEVQESGETACTHEMVRYENLGLTHSGECEYCHETMDEEAHIDEDNDMCCDACFANVSNLAPSEGEGYVSAEMTLNESIKISIAANKDEVSKIIVSSWYDIDDERIYETEVEYNETTGLYEVEIAFAMVSGADGTYYFDAAIYDEAGNMRYVRISEVEYVRNGISSVTTNRTPDGDIEVTVDAVEGGEIYIATDGEVPTETSAWMPYSAGQNYTVEDEGKQIREVQVYYKASTIITEPKVESVGTVSWNKNNTYTYTDEYGTFSYIKDSTEKYARVTRCSPKGVAVRIPENVDGIRVISIGNTNTSYNIFGTSTTYKNVKEISLPQGLEVIDGGAFQYCVNLTGTLKIPDSVTTISRCCI